MSADPHAAALNPAVLARAEQFERALTLRLAKLTPVDTWMVVVGVSLATCIELGTQVAVNIVLVDMQGNVAASQDEISWVIIVYAAAFLSVLPLSEWFTQRLGLRNYLVLSLLLYSLGALGCFLSGTLWQLLMARGIMGVGGGAFLVRALITLYRLHQGKQVMETLLVFACFVTSARALVPVVFAAVTDYGRWNLAFLVIVPAALLAAAILYLFLPRRLDFQPGPPPTDLIGTGLLVAGLVAFQVVASRGEQDMWLESGVIRWMLALSLVCLALFAWWDTRRTNSNPLLNLRLLLSEPALASGIGLALILGAVLAAGIYVLPQYLRIIEGYSATQTSYFFCLDGFATLLGIVSGVKLMPHWTARGVVLTGFTVFGIANLLFVYTLTADTPAWDVCLILLLHGISIGMMAPGITNVLLGRASRRYISSGMTIYFFFRQLGGALGVAGTVVLVDLRETLHSSRLLDWANRLDPAVYQVLGRFGRLLHARGLPANTATLGSYQLIQGLVVKQTMLLSFIDVFWSLALVTLVGVVLTLAHWRRQEATPVATVLHHY